MKQDGWHRSSPNSYALRVINQSKVKKLKEKRKKKKNEATASYTVCIPQESLPISFLCSPQKT